MKLADALGDPGGGGGGTAWQILLITSSNAF
jgi:hypothetical protein